MERQASPKCRMSPRCQAFPKYCTPSQHPRGIADRLQKDFTDSTASDYESHANEKAERPCSMRYKDGWQDAWPKAFESGWEAGMRAVDDDWDSLADEEEVCSTCERYAEAKIRCMQGLGALAIRLNQLPVEGAVALMIGGGFASMLFTVCIITCVAVWRGD